MRQTSLTQPFSRKNRLRNERHFTQSLSAPTMDWVKTDDLSVLLAVTLVGVYALAKFLKPQRLFSSFIFALALSLITFPVSCTRFFWVDRQM